MPPTALPLAELATGPRYSGCRPSCQGGLGVVGADNLLLQSAAAKAVPMQWWWSRLPQRQCSVALWVAEWGSSAPQILQRWGLAVVEGVGAWGSLRLSWALR